MMAQQDRRISEAIDREQARIAASSGGRCACSIGEESPSHTVNRRGPGWLTKATTGRFPSFRSRARSQAATSRETQCPGMGIALPAAAAQERPRLARCRITCELGIDLRIGSSMPASVQPASWKLLPVLAEHW